MNPTEPKKTSEESPKMKDQHVTIRYASIVEAELPAERGKCEGLDVRFDLVRHP